VVLQSVIRVKQLWYHSSKAGKEAWALFEITRRDNERSYIL
jgi:hypothetical protein